MKLFLKDLYINTKGRIKTFLKHTIRVTYDGIIFVSLFQIAIHLMK